MNTWPRPCARCGRSISSPRQPVPGCLAHKGRGLCGACRSSAKKADELLDYPRTHYTREELLEEWAVLTDQGYRTAQIAERLGLTHGAVTRALARARAASPQTPRPATAGLGK